jgi:chromosome segregation and condensation protein ScpB
MSDGVCEVVVQRGREAASRGDWQEAFGLLMQADQDGHMSAAELPVLAEVAYAAGHLDVTIEALERAHTG